MNKTTLVAVTILAGVVVAGGSFVGGVMVGRVTEHRTAVAPPIADSSTGARPLAFGGGQRGFNESPEMREIVGLLRNASSTTLQTVLNDLQAAGTSNSTSGGSVQ